MQNTSTYSDGSPVSGSDTKQKIADAASQAKDKLAGMGRTAASKIDQNRERAADGLERAPSAIHQKAHSLPGGEKVSNIAHTASHKLAKTATYVRQNDVNNM